MDYQEIYTDGEGALRRRARAQAAPGPTEVRVHVLAVSLNFRDVYAIRGNRFRAPLTDRVPCSDAVGRVLAVGAAVERFRPGDRVCTTVLPNWQDGPLTQEGLAGSLGSAGRDGVLAEQLLLDQEHLVAAPAYLSDVEAATLPVAALTAWHAVVELGALKAGDTVVVQTTGGVAVFAMQFAAAIGARVIVVSRSAEKLRRAREAGATDVIDTGLSPDWERAVLALTGGKGAQLVLDMGLTDSLRRSATAAAFEGTVAIIGVVQEHVNPLDIFTVMNKNVRVRGVETGSRAMFERMNRFLDEHRLRPAVEAVFGADRVDAALDRLLASPFGKVVLTWETDPGRGDW